MSLSTLPYNDRRVEYDASAGQTDFWFDFPLARALDLSLTRKRGGELSALSQPRDYQVVQFGQSGGTVRLTFGAQAGDVLELFGERKIERTTSFSQRGDFSADAINDEFNHVYMILQELKEQHEDMVQVPLTAADAISATGLHILAQDARGHTVTLDASAFMGAPGIRGERGRPGPIGVSSELPSFLAETNAGCVIGSISGGVIGEDKTECDSGDVFSLAAAPGILGYNSEKKLEVFGRGEFKGIRGERGRPGPIGVSGRVGSSGVRGERGRVGPGGVRGERGRVGPGGVRGERGRVGPGGVRGEPGEPGAPGPIGPRGEVPSVIAQAQSGALISSVSGGLIGEEDGQTQGYIFSSVSARNITYQAQPGGLSFTIEEGLNRLERIKAGRNDPVNGGLIGQQSDVVRPAGDVASEPPQPQQPTTIYGGTF